jgi:hypothetical protein
VGHGLYVDAVTGVRCLRHEHNNWYGGSRPLRRYSHGREMFKTRTQ